MCLCISLLGSSVHILLFFTPEGQSHFHTSLLRLGTGGEGAKTPFASKTNEKPDFGFNVVFGPTTNFISLRPSFLSLLFSSFSFLSFILLLQMKPLVLTREAGLVWGLPWLDSGCVRGPRDGGMGGVGEDGLAFLFLPPSLLSCPSTSLFYPISFSSSIFCLSYSPQFFPLLIYLLGLYPQLPCHLFTGWVAWPSRMQMQTLRVKYDSLMVQSISENMTALVFRVVCSGMVFLVRCEDSSRKA